MCEGSRKGNSFCAAFGWFFFFSIRRWHTRCLSDWSSDVCSSDLHRQRRPERDHADVGGVALVPRTRVRELDELNAHRSEERRVGKECRAAWAPEHKKKKKKNNPECVLRM